LYKYTIKRHNELVMMTVFGEVFSMFISKSGKHDK